MKRTITHTRTHTSVMYSDTQSVLSGSAYHGDINAYYGGTARMLCVRIPTYHTGLPVVLVRRDWNFTIEEFDPYVCNFGFIF